MFSQVPDSQSYLTKRMEFLPKEEFSSLDPFIFEVSTAKKKKTSKSRVKS
jgi:hypothetical protein